MRTQTSRALSISRSVAFSLAVLVPLLWQAKGNAEGKKEFKGAVIEGDRLVLKPGFKLRKVSESRFETFQESAESGPTARSVTKPVKTVDGINVTCRCKNTFKTPCTTVVTSGGASCQPKNCNSGCEMIATE